MKSLQISTFLLIVFSGCLLVSSVLIAQVDSSGAYFSLFSDHKSTSVGDIVTVHIMEFSSGSNQAATTTKKKDKVGFDVVGSGLLADYVPSLGAGGSKQAEFSGQGSTSQKANLRAKISARIVEKISENMLKIEGKRIVNVNGDQQTIILTGLVRTQDITANNIIYSYNIADAKISYKGKGVVNQGQRPGWIFRVINWIF